MESSDAVEAIVRDAFEDVALLIGGTATLHRIEDGVVRALVRRLDRVRVRVFSRLSRACPRAPGEAGRGCPHRLHPAVEGFLQRNRQARPERRKGVARAK